MYRYVFPDGELLDVGDTVLAMEAAGFEVRDVESLREHYARTLRHWVANLEERWDEAIALVGWRRARIWRLYMAVSALGFEAGGLAVHQILGVVLGPGGASGMPAPETPGPPGDGPNRERGGGPGGSPRGMSSGAGAGSITGEHHGRHPGHQRRGG